MSPRTAPVERDNKRMRRITVIDANFSDRRFRIVVQRDDGTGACAVGGVDGVDSLTDDKHFVAPRLRCLLVSGQQVLGNKKIYYRDIAERLANALPNKRRFAIGNAARLIDAVEEIRCMISAGDQ